MIKIQRSEDGPFVVFALSGRLRAEHVAELDGLFQVEAGRPIRLDLKDVNLVDADFVEFLARCELAGVVLTNCSGYVREWITRTMDRP